MKEKIKRILIILMAMVMVLITAPFYVIYAFGKTLCDYDEWIGFFEKLWTLFFVPIDIENLKLSEKYLRDENEKLKKRIEELEGKK